MHINRKSVLFLAVLSGRLLWAEERKLEQAIQLALDHHREIANSMLGVAIAENRLVATHTHRLPSMNF